MLLDNGRTRALADEVGRQALRCIRCSACLNVCPVYERTGGHAYGSVYPGPIGAILNPLLKGVGSTNRPTPCPTRRRSAAPASRSARCASTSRRSSSTFGRRSSTRTAGAAPDPSEAVAMKGAASGGRARARGSGLAERVDRLGGRRLLGRLPDRDPRGPRRGTCRCRRRVLPGLVEADGRTRVSARDDILAATARARRQIRAGAVPRGPRETGSADPSMCWTCSWSGSLTTAPSWCAARPTRSRRGSPTPCRPARDRRTRRPAVDVPGGIPDTDLSSADLDLVEAVVTGAAVGVASTGTIVLSHGPGQGRRALTLVPDLHVCVVLADQVVADVPDAVALLDPHRPTTWVSGPQRRATSSCSGSRACTGRAPCT